MLVWTYRGIAAVGAGLDLGLAGVCAAGLLALVLALAKPTWTRDTEIVDPGRIAVVLDTSASMGLADRSGQSRFERPRRAVATLRKAVAADTSAAVEVDLFDIAGAPLADDRASRSPNAPTWCARVPETIARLRSRPLAGVVLVSDGMDNTGRRDLRELAYAPVPVHGVRLPGGPGRGRA